MAGKAMRISKARAFTLLTAAVVLAALALRLIVSAELLKSDFLVSDPPVSTDMGVYLDLAGKLMRGEHGGEPFYFQPLYYAVFLPLVQLSLGASKWALLTAQSLLGAGTVWMACLAAAKIWGRKAGLLAGALCALSSLLLFFTPFALIETLQAFLVTALFLQTLEAMRKGGLARWCLAGGLLGLAILARANVWMLAPVLALACVCEQRRREGALKTALCLLALLFGTMLPQAPFIWHNSVLTGKLSGPSTGGPSVLALGVNPEAPPAILEYPVSSKLWLEDAKAGGSSIPSKVLAWAAAEPLAFAELQFRRALLFWDKADLPNGMSLEKEGPLSRVISSPLAVPKWLTMALALAGALACLRGAPGRKGALLLLLFVAAYWLSLQPTSLVDRYKAPVAPLLSALGGAFLALCLRDLAKLKLKELLLHKGCALALGLFFATSAYSLYSSHLEVAAMRLARPDGVIERFPGKGELVLDNGPFSMGGWSLAPLEKGSVIEKRYSKKASFASFEKLQFAFPCVWGGAGSATLRLNGQERKFSSKKAGEDMVEFRVPSPPDGVFRLEALDLEGAPVGVSFDFKRNYGRTSVNGEKVEAELVASCALLEN